jgi:hypothetical protein
MLVRLVTATIAEHIPRDRAVLAKTEDALGHSDGAARQVGR